jgi:hypothetical protein
MSLYVIREKLNIEKEEQWLKGNYKTKRKSRRGKEVLDMRIGWIRHVDAHGQSERGCSSFDDEMVVSRS